MLKLLSALFSFIDRIGKFLADRQLLNAGRAEQKVKAMEDVNERIEAAGRAVADPDPARDDRLRKRFDRSRRGQ
jgi:hypothetical protein